LGGAGKRDEVLNLVESAVADSLTERDREAMPSRPFEQRWRNTASWARKHMINEGLLERGSPTGIWEISDKGRRLLT